MTWDDFRMLFIGKYFPTSARHAKPREFLELRQGTMTILEYVARFTELAHFGDDYVAIVAAKVKKFEDGLNLSIRGRIVGHNLQDMDSMVSTALIIEREVDDAHSIRDAGASDRKSGEPRFFFRLGKKVEDFCSMRVSGVGPRPTGPRSSPGYQSGWTDDMFPLPSAGTHEAELSSDTGVSGSRDTTVPIISGT